jgi:hypothetical protein
MKDVMFVAIVSAVFAPFTIVPYLRRRTEEDKAILELRKQRYTQV